MITVKKEARHFCEIHGIPFDRLFDATGFKRSEYKFEMQIEEKWAAYGVRTCKNGHELRNRHGTCLICKPERVAFMLRSKMPGYLYIASGDQGRLMKLGFSGDPQNRIKIANYDAWGSYSDWTLRAVAWAEEAGALECELHAEFAHIRVPLHWDRRCVPQITRESYLADIEGAVSKLAWLCDSPPQIAPPPWH